MTSPCTFIINSSEGADLLPLSYTNNDFDGLFDDESDQIDETKTSATVSKDSTTSTSSSSLRPITSQKQHGGQQLSFQQQQAYAIEQQLKLLRHQSPKANDSLRLMKLQSYLVQKRLEKAEYCLQRANTNERLKTSATLHQIRKQDPQFLSHIPNVQSSGVDIDSPNDPLANLTVISNPIAVTGKGELVTTPLLNQYFSLETNNTMGGDRGSLSNEVPSVNVTSSLAPPKINVKSKKRSLSVDSTCTIASNVSASHTNNIHPNKFPKTSSRHQYVKVVASKLPKKQEKNFNHPANDSPTTTYMEILRSRSYNTSCFQSTSKYFSKPSKLQKASFGNEVIKNVHNRDCKSLKDLISCGLSPNPCNQFGDSLLNTVCKRGYQDIFHTFMECGASISTTDQFGRTPLHFACWSSNNSFSIVEKIISLDVNMLRATDKVGKTPLDYVSSDKWDEWNQFLKEKEEIFWPKDSADTALVCTYDAMECSILPDPVNAMSEDMAKRVSSGSFRLKNNL